ncbi:MAG: hypothetical protein HQL07_03270 [Nitrospirae bacterium]|nr:hypothetical protein [Magnetococcales bacterium]
MTTSSAKGRTSISLLAGAALMTAGLVAPQNAHADLATATILGGVALFTSLAHASEPVAPVIAYPQASVPPPVMMAQPMAMPMPMLSPLHEPMVYSSVSPTAAPAPQIPQMQQISYQVSAPSAPPINMPSYQTGPSPVYQQPMMQPQMPQQMPQQSYQQYSTGGMPVTAGYPQGQQQGYPMMQQAAMMPQQQNGVVSYQPAMMPQQQAAMMPQQQPAMMPQQQPMMPQQQAMPQGGYGASMPSTTFAYAR